MKSNDPDYRPDIKSLMDELNKDIFKLKCSLDSSSIDKFIKIKKLCEEDQKIIEILKLYL